MSDADWVACRDPRIMLDFLLRRGELSERVARFFACACCRRVWDAITDPRSRTAIETAERSAEWGAGSDLEQACRAADEVVIELEGESPPRLHVIAAARAAASSAASAPRLYTVASDAAWSRAYLTASAAGTATVDGTSREQEWSAALDAEQAHQAVILRDILSRRFRRGDRPGN